MGFNWTCPYCNTRTTINDDRHGEGESDSPVKGVEGYKRLKTKWIVCPNNECTRITLYANLYDLAYVPHVWKERDLIRQWRLLPDNTAKVFPSYIPDPLIKDYQEASAIINLSPKASATLARRCLQGIIRDFWKVTKPRLIDEINAIEDKVDPLTWKSIDAVRKVGNIGAHMEKDINLIIDVEPNEARLLIDLIEMLFEEWYIHRHEREQKLKAIIEVAKGKDEVNKG